MSNKHGGGQANRLINETSPYLLQHAYNPVAWHPWGDEALRRARETQKPIFLSIGYSACHWCHVMERESFEDEAVAAVLNRDFVAIKVDREERPDLDEIYMRAVQMMTGRGGWPLSVFLTPDLKPFFGGTYFPPESRYGMPGFGSVLERVASIWRDRRGDVLGTADQLTEALRQRTDGASHPAPEIGRELVADAVRALTRSFDARWGGFGGSPKFPPSGAISLLLREVAREGDDSLLGMATHTLDRMAYGGLYDQVGGGFHRYSVDEKWLVPHFEKMLYDNALLSRAYLEAYQLTKKPLYRRIAAETLDFVLREMTDEQGGFHSTLDADSEGEEGKFYIWTPQELKSALSPADAELAVDYYGVTRGGNFEGRNILHVPVPLAEFAKRSGSTEEEVAARLAGVRKELLAARQSRVRPAKDDKILASWNGLMISSMSQAARVLGERRFLDAAERAGRFILDHMMADGDLNHSIRLGRGKRGGYLDDYAFVANGFIDLYNASLDDRWLASADALAERMVALFRDDTGQGFAFTSSGHNDLLTRTKSFTDGAMPSGNSVAAAALLRLARLTDNRGYTAEVQGIFAAAASAAGRHPEAFTALLCALDFHLAPPREVVIAGKPGAQDTARLLEAVSSVFLPNVVFAFGSTAGPASRAQTFAMPLLEGKIPLGGAAAAYVCEDFACRKPMTDADDLASLLAEWTAARGRPSPSAKAAP